MQRVLFFYYDAAGGASGETNESRFAKIAAILPCSLHNLQRRAARYHTYAFEAPAHSKVCQHHIAYFAVDAKLNAGKALTLGEDALEAIALLTGYATE